jgi:hypothetical protein
MVTDQNHPSDSMYNEQEAIRYIEKIAKLLGTDKQNAEVYITLSDENRVLKKQLKEYHSQHNTFERKVKRLERDVKALDDCLDTDAVVDLIQEIVPLLVKEKSLIKNNPSSYSSESFEESNSNGRLQSNGIIKGSHKCQVRKKKAVPHK